MIIKKRISHLMCCLKYEQEAYESLLRITPRQGAIVNTPDGRGQVVEANLLTGAIKVRLEKAPDSPPALYRREDVKVIRDGRGRPQREAAEPAGDAE